jgi:hypothetical protein
LTVTILSFHFPTWFVFFMPFLKLVIMLFVDMYVVRNGIRKGENENMIRKDTRSS